MLIRRRALAFASAALLLTSSALFAQVKEPQQVRKLSTDEKKELQTISAMLASGPPAQNDLSMTFVGSDLLKAQGNKEYVPFTVALDGAMATSGKLSLYWRVVAKDAPPDPKKGGASSYAFENIHTLTVPSGLTAPMRISRSFVVPAGAYDLIVVAKEPDPKKKSDPPAKISVLRQPITVADLWNGEFNTSSVIVGRLDPLAAPLTPTQQEERPYAMGTMEIQPAISAKFTKKDELSVFLLIYNPKLDATSNAPDLTVEYNFYVVQNGTEKFFNKTNPQSLNAQTLPSGFDPTSGVTNGQTVPLGSFPEGEYRLEIKITDKVATKSLTREVRFSVAGS